MASDCITIDLADARRQLLPLEGMNIFHFGLGYANTLLGKMGSDDVASASLMLEAAWCLRLGSAELGSGTPFRTLEESLAKLGRLKISRVSLDDTGTLEISGHSFLLATLGNRGGMDWAVFFDDQRIFPNPFMKGHRHWISARDRALTHGWSYGRNPYVEGE